MSFYIGSLIVVSGNCEIKPVLLDRIQSVINCSAHLIYKAPKSAHITPLLFDLHWLLISSWIQYKLSLIHI